LKKLDEDYAEDPFHQVIYFTLYDFADPKVVLTKLHNEITPVTNDLYEKFKVNSDQPDKIANYNEMFKVLELFEYTANCFIMKGCIKEKFRKIYIVKI
jgi:hypothetical protein